MRYTPAEIHRHLARYRQSGLTVRAFCTRHSLKYWTFLDWRKRFSITHPEPESPFVKVDLPSASFIEIVTASNATIRLPLDQDADRIRLLLAAIKRSGLA